ncbi:MAG: TlpA disulfide reductase family protein, partial [Chitinophagales bacterium]
AITSCKKKGVLEGDWYAALKINDTLEIPFVLNINESKVYWDVSVYNANETIQLDATQLKDSLFLKFPAFDSELRLKIKNRGRLEGKWYNYDKDDYTMPVYANYDINKYITSNSLENVTGQWEVHFAEGSEQEWPAIGLFDQNENDELIGTFRTETGDYRYLSGTLNDNNFSVSTFDGANAYLFTAVVKDDGESMDDGMFYSGKHYETNWIAYKNKNIELSNPESLTQLVENEKFEFTFPNYDFINETTFPSELYDNKVVIIQIFGSWCPNCMDETKYLSKLYKQHENDDFEIIGVAFEHSQDKAKITSRLTKYMEDLAVDYTILYGGNSTKEAASVAFPMLDQVKAFPTTLFIDKKGQVRKIHTGFDGPGTGEIYQIIKGLQINSSILFLEE